MIIQQGLQLRTKDERDFTVGGFFDLPKPETLPAEYWIEPLSIKDQNADENFDFCAGCAGAGMIEPKEEVILYYPYLWAAAKYESGQDIGSFGVDIRSIGKALTKWGVPEMKDVPESVLKLTAEQRRDFKNYPQSLRDLAGKHKAQTYMFVEGMYDAYDDVRATIWKFRDLRQQVIFGCYWQWDTADFALTGVKNTGFGHAMWISGFQSSGMRVVNSVGKKAGRMGTHVMARDTFNNAVKDYGALMIVDKPRDDIQYFMDNKIREGDNWITQILKVFWNLIASPFYTTKEKGDIIKKASTTLDELAKKLEPRTPVVDVIIDIPMEKNLLDVMCESIKDYEGYFEPSAKYPTGSNSYRCRNPGNLKFAGQIGSIGKNEKGFAIFGTYAEGYMALKRQIMLVARSKSAVYPNDCTLVGFFKIYAPTADNNEPLAYAKYVAKKMGVVLDWKLSELSIYK